MYEVESTRESVAKLSAFLGQPQEAVVRSLTAGGFRCEIEITEPTRKLGTSGQLRVINIDEKQGGVIRLTCAREFI